MRAVVVAVVAVSAVDVAAFTCEDGCNLQRQACRVGAGFERIEARAVCERVFGECSDSCDGNRSACRDACDETFSDCRGACPPADDAATCRAACELDHDGCVGACSGSREQCRGHCDLDHEHCDAAARLERQQVNAQCDSRRDGCDQVCASGGGCTDACGRAATICFAQGRRALRACRAPCSEGEAGKDCRRGCRSEQVGTDTGCTQVLDACNGDCEPDVPENVSKNSTTTIPGSETTVPALWLILPEAEAPDSGVLEPGAAAEPEE